MFDQLYEDSGPFMSYYQEVTEAFYSEYFDSKAEMKDFFLSVIEIQRKDTVPMQMMNQVRRFISLSKNIEKIYPARDPLRILFIRICIESLQHLSGQKNLKHFMPNFLHHIEPQGKEYILKNFKLSYIEFDKNAELMCRDGQAKYQISFYDSFKTEFSIDNFFVLIKKIRDTVVHEGTFWETVIFEEDEEYPAITTFHAKADENIFPLKDESINYNGFCTYVFNTSLSFEKFIWYFVRTCIEYIKSYIAYI